ncbi:MAG: GtrA family protein [Oscillospiraceae bacterium]|nr:GtrA family protein [Oscillospiraceae bacterium]
MAELKKFAVYAFFGVLTTLVSMGVFEGLERLLKPRKGGHSYLLSNIVAFVVALVFAFVVNKLFVFEQTSWERGLVFHEAWTFTAARLFSGGLDYALTFVFFDLLWPKARHRFTGLWQGRVSPFVRRLKLPGGLRRRWDQVTPEGAFRFLAKWGFIAVLVVVLNYFFSNGVVFKHREGGSP